MKLLVQGTVKPRSFPRTPQTSGPTTRTTQTLEPVPVNERLGETRVGILVTQPDLYPV